MPEKSAAPYGGKTLTLIAEAEKEVKALAVAPGGNIIQHIEPDTNDPRLWDVANSKILNLQLVDSRTFRLVTGLKPPDTPITPDTYETLGMPFYQLWRDEAKGAGVSGKWGDVKGAKATASWNLKSKWKGLGMTGHDAVEPGESSAYGETGDWGLLQSGAWGKLNDEEVREEGSSSVEEMDFKESSFDFPIALLDVDATIPKFKSVVDEDGDWNAEDIYD